MPVPTQRTRSSFRALSLVTLASVVLMLPVGCEIFHGEKAPPPEPPVVLPPELTALAATPPVVPTLPGKHATRRGCCVFYHDFDLSHDDPIFTEVESLPDQVYGELHLPPGNAIVQVFLFDTQARYERYMFDKEVGRYRGQPSRRAYFFAEPRVGGGEELKIFTWMGEHVRIDLRHELTHALLNGVLKHVPLWLDEGLAGYFELPPANEGVNPQHLETLRRGPFQPDLARLEKLKEVAQMQKPEYREAWAWVHFMLHSDPNTRKALLDYLQSLRTTPTPGLLLLKLRETVPDVDRGLLEHLAKLDSGQSRRK